MTPREKLIRDLLATRRGLDEALSAPAIQAETGIPSREVRRIIARQLDAPTWTGDDTELFVICAAPRRGYFVAADTEEIYTYRSWLSLLVVTAQSKLLSFDQRCAQLGIPLEGKRPATKTAGAQSLVRQALAKQQADGITDYVLCKRTGINAGTWSRIRRGSYDRRVQTRVAAKLQAFINS
jgi:hypothetical protein